MILIILVDSDNERTLYILYIHNIYINFDSDTEIKINKCFEII